MRDDVREIHERLDWCGQEIERVSRLSQEALGALIKFDVELDPARQEKAYYITMTGPLPIAVRSSVGCVVNEIRSCLDGLAVALAARNGKGPKGTYFPITKTAADHPANAKSKLADLSEADRLAILEMQTHGEANPDLFRMHEADRTRKHQRLGAATSTGSSFQAGGILMKGGGANRIIGSNLNGVFVRDLTYFGRLDLDEEGYGQRRLVAKGVPTALPIVISVDPTFQSPDALKGLTIFPELRKWRELAVQIVNRFT